MSLVAPLAAIDPVLASLFTFSSKPVLVPDSTKCNLTALADQVKPPENETMARTKQTARKRPNARGPRKQKFKTRATPKGSQSTYSPSDEEALALFRRMKKNEPDVVYAVKELKQTLLSEMRWTISFKRLHNLWIQVAETELINSDGGRGNDDEVLDHVSDLSGEVKSEPIETPLLGPTNESLTATANNNDHELHSASLVAENEDMPNFDTSLALMSPSDIEVMTFLWDLEQEHSQMVEDTRGLLRFMVQYKNWKVSEERLHKILNKIEEANADDTFDMPLADHAKSSNQQDILPLPPSPPNRAEQETSLDKAQDALLNALVAPSPGQQAQSLREIVHTRVRAQNETHANKITNMLLDMEDAGLVSLIADSTRLEQKIDALFNLCVHNANSENRMAVAHAGRQAMMAVDSTSRESLSNAGPDLPRPIEQERSNEDIAKTYTRDELLHHNPKRRRHV